MSDFNPKLGDLIDATQQDALAQQDKVEKNIHQVAKQPRAKQIFTALLLAVFAVVMFTQYPRFSEPYAWPDPSTHPGAAEGELITVVGLIEAYRISQGRYPATLSQVAIPEGLAALIADSALDYRAAEQSYTLDWTLPHWQASYNSVTEKVSVVPAAKK